MLYALSKGAGTRGGLVEIVMLEKLDCILSKRATRPYIYESTSVNACVRIYV